MEIFRTDSSNYVSVKATKFGLPNSSKIPVSSSILERRPRTLKCTIEIDTDRSRERIRAEIFPGISLSKLEESHDILSESSLLNETGRMLLRALAVAERGLLRRRRLDIGFCIEFKISKMKVLGRTSPRRGMVLTSLDKSHFGLERNAAPPNP